MSNSRSDDAAVPFFHAAPPGEVARARAPQVASPGCERLKRLLLLRHAKAETAGRVDDVQRDLTDKGEGDAARLGGRLERIGFTPDLAFVSPARRTARTFEIAAARFARPAIVKTEQSLYNATAAQIRAAIAGADPASRTLMVVGHNPGIMTAAAELAGDGDWAELDAMRQRFPPCALAVLTFRAEDWNEIRPGGGWLETFLTADDLTRDDLTPDSRTPAD